MSQSWADDVASQHGESEEALGVYNNPLTFREPIEKDPEVMRMIARVCGAVPILRAIRGGKEVDTDKLPAMSVKQLHKVHWCEDDTYLLRDYCHVSAEFDKAFQEWEGSMDPANNGGFSASTKPKTRRKWYARRTKFREQNPVMRALHAMVTNEVLTAFWSSFDARPTKPTQEAVATTTEGKKEEEETKTHVPTRAERRNSAVKPRKDKGSFFHKKKREDPYAAHRLPPRKLKFLEEELGDGEDFECARDVIRSMWKTALPKGRDAVRFFLEIPTKHDVFSADAEDSENHPYQLRDFLAYWDTMQEKHAGILRDEAAALEAIENRNAPGDAGFVQNYGYPNTTNHMCARQWLHTRNNGKKTMTEAAWFKANPLCE